MEDDPAPGARPGPRPGPRPEPRQEVRHDVVDDVRRALTDLAGREPEEQAAGYQDLETSMRETLRTAGEDT